VHLHGLGVAVGGEASRCSVAYLGSSTHTASHRPYIILERAWCQVLNASCAALHLYGVSVEARRDIVTDLAAWALPHRRRGEGEVSGTEGVIMRACCHNQWEACAWWQNVRTLLHRLLVISSSLWNWKGFKC